MNSANRSGYLLSRRAVWLGPALVAFGLVLLTITLRLVGGALGNAATSGWFEGTAALPLDVAQVGALAAAGALSAIALLIGALAAQVRSAPMGALAIALAAGAFGFMTRSGVAPQWGARWDMQLLGLQGLSMIWVGWALFESRSTRVRIAQIQRAGATAGWIVLLLSCLAPMDLDPGVCLAFGAGLLAVSAAGLDDVRRNGQPRALWPFAVSLAMQAGIIGWHAVHADHSAWSEAARDTSQLVALALLIASVFVDRRERHQEGTEAARRATEAARKYRHVYYSVPVALVSIELTGQILRWNDMADTYFGQRLSKGRLNDVSALIGEDGMRQLIDSAASKGRHHREARLAHTENGSTVERVFAVDALLVGNSIEISFVDVTERSRLADMLEHMAYHDFLTDALNRRGLEHHLDQQLEASRRDRDLCVIYIDLDRFKFINDVFGHAAGDRVVIEVSRRIAKLVPESAGVGRIGGDEFVVVLAETRFEDATAVAGQLMAAIATQPYDFEGTRLEVEASIGVVAATAGINTRELLAQADEACAQSKRNGRGKITSMQTTAESLSKYRAELYYGTQLKSRLPIDRIALHAQPLVPLHDSGEPMSYEVLLRTLDEQGVPHSPSRLLAAAERQGAMAAVDRFVLSKTIEHLSEHSRFTSGLGFVTVNLSGMSLNDDTFVRDSIAMLKESPRVASAICLEITESIALYDMRNTSRFVDQMRSIGVRVALDDFGAGYTSFAYLKDLPASLVKIDGQFILDIARDTKQRGIVRAIQQLTRELGMACLAEWVEDVPTLRTLLELEVDYAQGFVLARPQPLAHWLEHDVDLEPLTRARRGLKTNHLSKQSPRRLAMPAAETS